MLCIIFISLFDDDDDDDGWLAVVGVNQLGEGVFNTHLSSVVKRLVTPFKPWECNSLNKFKSVFPGHYLTC